MVYNSYFQLLQLLPASILFYVKIFINPLYKKTWKASYGVFWYFTTSKPHTWYFTNAVNI